MNYIEKVLTQLKERNPGEHEFHQAATEILLTLEPVFKKHPEYEKAALLERFVEPERAILFRIPWMDDKGRVHINKGYRVQFNSAIGPYKGCLLYTSDFIILGNRFFIRKCNGCSTIFVIELLR